MICLSNTLPFRICSVHWCTDHPTDGKLLLLAGFPFLEKQVRARIRIHVGDPAECVSQLRTFGIHPSLLPFDEQGEFALNVHLEWMKHRETVEQTRKEGKEQLRPFYGGGSGYIALSDDTAVERLDRADTDRVVPMPQDVLCGIGISHPGNDYFRYLITSKLSLYNNAASKFDKTLLTLQVISQVKESGGRFLKMRGKEWYVAQDEEARNKVASSFRNQRKVKSKLPSAGKR